MKLTAIKTVHHNGKIDGPGEDFEVADKDTADALIARRKAGKRGEVDVDPPEPVDTAAAPPAPAPSKGKKP